MPKREPRQYFDWQNRPRQLPGESLPKLPDGRTKKDFPSYRAYLDARAQYAGYRNFNEWEKARKQAGVQKPTPARVPKPSKNVVNLKKNGNVYIFEFEKEGKTGKTIPIQRQYTLFRQMDALIRSLEPDKFIQIYYLAHTYAKANEDRPIDQWDWGSTTLIQVSNFKKYEYKQFGHSMLNVFYEWIGVRPYTFPEEKEDFPQGYSFRMRGKQILGFREVHIAVWNPLNK